MKATTVYKPQIALNLPRVVALLLVFVRHVIAMMTKNAAIFVDPVPSLADVAKHADELEAAEVEARSRAKGAVPVRDEKKRIVETDLILLKAYVFALAFASPELGASIIECSGMSAKRLAFRLKPPLEALLGPDLLEVLLRAKAAAKKAFYEWQYSADDGASWVDLRPTNQASTTLTVPTAGVTYLFRFRATVKNVTGDWSQVVSLPVPAH